MYGKYFEKINWNDFQEKPNLIISRHNIEHILDTHNYFEILLKNIEEHSIIGGLGGAVAEILAETDRLRGKRFRRIGIPDKFADQYGSQKSLMESFGISAENLEDTIQSMFSN